MEINEMELDSKELLSTIFQVSLFSYNDFILFAPIIVTYYFAEERGEIYYNEENSWRGAVVMRPERHHLYIYSVEPRICNRVSRRVR